MKEAKFVNVNLGSCFKGSLKIWEKWYQFITTQSSEKQKSDFELLVYTLNEKYQPTDIKLAGLFKKEFDDGNKTYSATCSIAWVKYFVNFQKAKDKDKETGKECVDVCVTVCACLRRKECVCVWATHFSKYY